MYEKINLTLSNNCFISIYLLTDFIKKEYKMLKKFLFSNVSQIIVTLLSTTILVYLLYKDREINVYTASVFFIAVLPWLMDTLNGIEFFGIKATAKKIVQEEMKFFDDDLSTTKKELEYVKTVLEFVL